VKRRAPDLAAALPAASATLAALDWQALGEVYFHWGGEAFWAEKRPDVLRLGEALARALAGRLPRGGRSLWVGAGVAELPVLLVETMALGREVVACNLRAAEVDALNAGLAKAGHGASLRYVAADAATADGEAAFDHVGCVSVFTDPETWPTLSGVSYGRLPPVQVDVERFVAERESARALAAAAFARLQRPGWITTTPEEVAWFLEQAERAGARIDAEEELVETAVVGDPVGFLRVR
jgi:hypothetical protein